MSRRIYLMRANDPGSYHDSKVWQLSAYYKGLIDGSIQLPFEEALIIGDSAFKVKRPRLQSNWPICTES